MHENHSITCDVRRVRGVAKGTPGMTFVNPRWRAGARQQTALAGCEGMSVRHPRTRPMSFVNGNREWVARSYCLSTRMECSANHCFIERSEPTLSFERARITANIRIVNGTRFHLVARVESLTVARIAHALKNCRGITNEIQKPSNKKSHKFVRNCAYAMTLRAQVCANHFARRKYSQKPVLESPRAGELYTS